jgi:predicted negative regulator of RcsB-dependent stress response
VGPPTVSNATFHNQLEYRSMTKTGAEARPTLDLDEGAEGLMDWVRANGKPLAIGVVAVAAVIAIGGIWRSFERTKEERGERALRQARQSYESGNLSLATSDLRKLVERYGGTQAGVRGSLLLAQALYDAGKPDSGLKALEGVSGGGPFGAAVEGMRAAGYEQQSKFDQAAQSYLEASKKAEATSEQAAYKADAARAYKAGGKNAEAEKLWRELSTSPDQSLATEALMRLGEVSAAPAKG